jgi:hypothetical protein
LERGRKNLQRGICGAKSERKKQRSPDLNCRHVKGVYFPSFSAGFIACFGKERQSSSGTALNLDLAVGRARAACF